MKDINTTDIYEPVSKNDRNYHRLIEKARKHNDRLDQIEREQGFATPHVGPFDERLRVVISALVAGIETTNWNCVAEGLEILQRTELELRKKLAERLAERQ